MDNGSRLFFDRLFISYLLMPKIVGSYVLISLCIISKFNNVLTMRMRLCALFFKKYHHYKITQFRIL